MRVSLEASGYRAPLHTLLVSGCSSESLCRLEDTDFRFLILLLWNREIILIQLCREKGCPGSGPGRNPLFSLVRICVAPCDDIDEAFATGNVDASEFSIEKHVIGIAGNCKVCHRSACGSVEDDQTRGCSTTNEQTVI